MVNIKKILVSGLALLMLCGTAMVFLPTDAIAQGHEGRGRAEGVSRPGGREGMHSGSAQQYRQFQDSRYNHNRSYMARGQYFGHLPDDHRPILYRNSRYYFAHGEWYRPVGDRFLVVAPPIGLFVPFLPAFYVSLWANGIPYYYANDVYYTPIAGGYVVAEPPSTDASTTPPPAAEPGTGGQLFIYPGKGQSEKQQANDRYECHVWAAGQTGYDPIKPPELPGNQLMQKRADYQRAVSACLEGRGYTVR